MNNVKYNVVLKRGDESHTIAEWSEILGIKAHNLYHRKYRGWDDERILNTPVKTKKMSYDQAIKHGKTRRKPYKGAKAVDLSCRNHGGCPICEGNRLHSDKMREQAAEEQLKED